MGHIRVDSSRDVLTRQYVRSTRWRSGISQIRPVISHVSSWLPKLIYCHLTGMISLGSTDAGSCWRRRHLLKECATKNTRFTSQTVIEPDQVWTQLLLTATRKTFTTSYLCWFFVLSSFYFYNWLHYSFSWYQSFVSSGVWLTNSEIWI